MASHRHTHASSPIFSDTDPSHTHLFTTRFFDISAIAELLSIAEIMQRDGAHFALCLKTLQSE